MLLILLGMAFLMLNQFQLEPRRPSIVGSTEKDSQEGFTEVKEFFYLKIKKSMINLLNAKSIFWDVSLMTQHFCRNVTKSLHSSSSWSPGNFWLLFRVKSAEPQWKANIWRRE